MPVSLKQDAPRLLADVPGEYVFWLQGGRTLSNMADMLDALRTMPDDTYAYHVNQEKNDFSNWVRDIIRDEKLANDLRKATSKRQAATRVSERINTLKKNLS
jgi:hypothetical protein